MPARLPCLHLLTAIALLAAAGNARAHTIATQTRNASFADNLAYRCAHYISEHGKLPPDWQAVEKAIWLSMSLDEIHPTITPSKRYAVINERVNLPGEGEVDVILMMRKPFREEVLGSGNFLSQTLWEPGRYVIFRRADGSVFSHLYPEPAIQRAFASAGVPLPKPDDLGPFPHEAVLSWESILIVGGTALLIIAYGGLRLYLFLQRGQPGGRRKRRRKKRPALD